MLPIAILCGGFGTRLLPLTQNKPKSLIDVRGEPFIYRQLINLQDNGYTKVVLCLGHQGEQIATYIMSEKRLEIEIVFSFDGDTNIGTGGALIKALPYLGKSFAVTYGDAFLLTNFKKVESCFLKSKTDALLTAYISKNSNKQNNLTIHNGKVKSYGKNEEVNLHTHIEYGLSYFNSDCFNLINIEMPVDLKDIYYRQIYKNDLNVLEITDEVFEIGSPNGLTEFINYLEDHN